MSAGPATDSGEAVSPGSMGDVIRRSSADRSAVERFYDIRWSEQRFDQIESLTDQWKARLAAIDFDALGRDDRIDLILLDNALSGAEADLALRRGRLEEMTALLPFRQTIIDLELARARMEPVDSESAAGLVAQLPDMIKAVRERIKAAERAPDQVEPTPAPGQQPEQETPDASVKIPGDGDAPGNDDAEEPSDSPVQATDDESDHEQIPVSPVLAARTARAVQSLRGTLSGWFRYHDGYEPGFSWWVREPFDKADAALGDYATFLRKKIAGLKGEDDDPLIGDPIGREALLEDLRHEMIAYSPEELIAIGQRELAWSQEQMKLAAQEMGLGDDWHAALEKVKADHAGPGGQTAVVTDLAREAIAFVKERDLVTIPPLAEQLWRLSMISPQGQRFLPFAAYNNQQIMVAYPTASMSYEDKLMSMRGNNRHFTRIVAPHELIPGHHLQGFMARRYHPYRQVFSTPFLVEGWALYWEMLLWDQGYATTPQDRIGMLFWRMHRAARIIVSLKFHLGQMQPDEMVDFLVSEVGHERHGATSEVRRYIAGEYSPLYQCAYMIGGLQLRALRREAVDSGRMTLKAFHDAVLRQGPIPIEMIRAGLMDEPLSRPYEASWRFDEPRPEGSD